MSAFAIAIMVLYFIPTFNALCARHPQSMAIALLNIFAGWSGVGWIGALVWSAVRQPRQS